MISSTALPPCRGFRPVLPLIGGGETKFAPVFVGDIAEAVARLIDRNEADGRTYELGGPRESEFQAADGIHARHHRPQAASGCRCRGPWPRSRAHVLGLLPKPLLTTDQVELLKSDNVVSEQARRERRTLEGLGIAPSGIEGIVPGYLYRYRKAGQFTAPKGMPE